MQKLVQYKKRKKKGGGGASFSQVLEFEFQYNLFVKNLRLLEWFCGSISGDATMVIGAGFKFLETSNHI